MNKFISRFAKDESGGFWRFDMMILTRARKSATFSLS